MFAHRLNARELFKASMHARELVDVAGLVALNGHLLAGGARPASPVYLEQYWEASKCRFESWSRALKVCASANYQDSKEDFDTWITVRASLDEIFASEMLTRVWNAVLVDCDRQDATSTAEPIARNVFTSHMEARHRAMALLIGGRGFTTHQAVALNRLRRRAERWTDVLLGGLIHLDGVREFAVEAERAEDFSHDLARRRNESGGSQAWRLTLVSLRNAFQTGLSPIAANPDSNARVTASILGCFSAELFDSTGIFQSLWMTRLAANASDVQGMISDLLRSNVPIDRPPSTPHRRPRRI